MMQTSTVDPAEVERFSALARKWWNPRGPMGVLHKFNPVRIGYVRDHAAVHFGRDVKGDAPLSGLSVLDIGCGGGLLSEPLARLGARVTALDPSTTNIEVARLHAAESGLDIDYRAITAEEIDTERFDVVMAMEVVEHVADVDLFVSAASNLVRPGGLLFLATINRTLKAYALAIIGAEYVLGWLPRGTHSYDRLVRPDELDRALTAAGLARKALDGVVYNPLYDEWRLAGDTDVNYMLVAEKLAA